MRVAGGLPGGFPAKIAVPLRADQRADSGAAAVLRALLGVIEANLEGTIEDLDSEFLHDLRVSVRRSRAVQRELRGVFPPAELEQFRAEFRWLQQATGDARDLDVHVLEFDAMRSLVGGPGQILRDDLEPLLGVLRARRVHARCRLVRRSALRTRDPAAVGAGACSWTGSRRLTRASARTPRGRSARSPASGSARCTGRWCGWASAIDDSSPAEEYHELRKKGKELRYLLELFGAPLFDGEVVKPMIRTLKGLQDVLGRHQDREVQVALLRSLAPRGREGGAWRGRR